MGGKKSSPPPAAPQPVYAPVQQKPVEPISRTATSAEARDRAASNQSADLMAGTTATEDDATKRTSASLMG